MCTSELLTEFVLKTNAINFDLCFSVFELESGYYICAFVCVCACVQWCVGEDAWVRMSVCGVCVHTFERKRERHHC